MTDHYSDRRKIDQLTAVRRHEQARMIAYQRSQECLMAFLARELGDPAPAACGRCAVCLGRPLLPITYAMDVAMAAADFLRHVDLPITPRRRWPGEALAAQGWRGAIAPNLRVEEGRALCIWGDAGWGEVVKHGTG